jgi:hypothetical protein
MFVHDVTIIAGTTLRGGSSTAVDRESYAAPPPPGGDTDLVWQANHSPPSITPEALITDKQVTALLRPPADRSAGPTADVAAAMQQTEQPHPHATGSAKLKLSEEQMKMLAELVQPGCPPKCDTLEGIAARGHTTVQTDVPARTADPMPPATEPAVKKQAKKPALSQKEMAELWKLKHPDNPRTIAMAKAAPDETGTVSPELDPNQCRRDPDCHYDKLKALETLNGASACPMPASRKKMAPPQAPAVTCEPSALYRPTINIDATAQKTFAFINYKADGSRKNARCEQPTMKVLRDLGYQLVDGGDVDLRSPPMVVVPRGYAVGGGPSSAGYTAKVMNSWTLGGPKYIQYAAFRDFAKASGCGRDLSPVLPFMPEQYILQDCEQCRAFFSRAIPTEGTETWYVKAALGEPSKLHAARGGEKQIHVRGSGGSLEPPGPLPTIRTSIPCIWGILSACLHVPS